MWVVYTEIHTDEGVERWYYGRWHDKHIANEVALELGGSWPTYHCVCQEQEAKDLGIMNMPRKKMD